MHQAKRCGAETRDGRPCERYAKPWQDRCDLHGGKSPMAERKAKELMLMARDWGFAELRDITEELKALPIPDGDLDAKLKQLNTRTGIVFKIFDRSGFGPSALLKVEPASGRQELEALTSEQLAAEADRIARELRSLGGETVDAERVEEVPLDEHEPVVSEHEPEDVPTVPVEKVGTSE